MISLSVENVSKSYGEMVAIDSISLKVEAGKIFGFLGPNGAGKTTTIRMLVGIMAPDTGKIELFGQPLSQKLQSTIGYLPEERGLYKKVNIQRQLRYFAALKGISRSEADKRIDFWLDRVNLSKWKLKKPDELSKGMQQKIQFVSTVLHDPELLVLDEPFSGLDPVNVETLLDIIDELKLRGKTIIFSTHLMETAEKLCDDLVLINNGKKILGGTIRQVKASFEKNLISLRCTGGENVLQDKAMVIKVTRHADEQEVLLSADVNPRQFLQKLLNNNAEISKFERIEPSLNSIFIEKVRESNA